MRQIEHYPAKKYENAPYSLVEEGIYRLEEDGETIYVTSLSFVQEPELGEGADAGEISQYPLEDILDEFCCDISDFYGELNTPGSPVCCQEFAAPDLESVRKLRGLIGKHVYNRETGGCVQLVVEQEDLQ